MLSRCEGPCRGVMATVKCIDDEQQLVVIVGHYDDHARDLVVTTHVPVATYANLVTTGQTIWRIVGDQLCPGEPCVHHNLVAQERGTFGKHKAIVLKCQ
jgi:hypothetical protein